MSVYYIETKGGVLYELDATLTIAYRLGSNITRLKVESGEDISDNIVLTNPSLSFSGVISDVKSTQGGLLTKDYIQGLETLRSNKELFTVYYNGHGANLKNCFFQSIEISQGDGFGTIEGKDTNISSYNIRLEITQIRLGGRTREALIRADEIADSTNDKSSANSATLSEDVEIGSRSRTEIADNLESIADPLIAAGLSGGT